MPSSQIHCVLHTEVLILSLDSGSFLSGRGGGWFRGDSASANIKWEDSVCMIWRKARVDNGYEFFCRFLFTSDWSVVWSQVLDEGPTTALAARPVCTGSATPWAHPELSPRSGDHSLAFGLSGFLSLSVRGVQNVRSQVMEKGILGEHGLAHSQRIVFFALFGV